MAEHIDKRGVGCDDCRLPVVIECHVCADHEPLRQVGTCRIEAVVPIVADAEEVGSAYWGPSCIEVGAISARLWPAWSGALEWSDGTDVDLGPNPAQHVGKWAVICRDVEVGA